jgi:hypothetical protein
MALTDEYVVAILNVALILDTWMRATNFLQIQQSICHTQEIPYAIIRITRAADSVLLC